jgi:hypothetical protein
LSPEIDLVVVKKIISLCIGRGKPTLCIRRKAAVLGTLWRCGWDTTVEIVSLGYTVLRDTEEHEVIIPNSVMASSVVIRLEQTSRSPDVTVG